MDTLVESFEFFHILDRLCLKITTINSLPLPSSYTKSLSGISKLICMKYNFASLAKQEKYKSLTAY